MLSLCIICKFFVALLFTIKSSISEPSVVKVVSVGFYGSSSSSLLSGLLGSEMMDVVQDKNITLFEDETTSSILAVRHLDDDALVPCGLSFVHITRAMMMNEEAVLHRLTTAIRSLRSSSSPDANALRPLVVILSGKATATVIQNLQTLVMDAWDRASRIDPLPLRKNDTIDISPQLLLLSEGSIVSSAAQRAVQDAIIMAMNFEEPLLDLNPTPQPPQEPLDSSIPSFDHHPDLALWCQESTRRGLRVTLQSASERIDQLNANASKDPGSFAALIEEVLRRSEQTQDAFLSERTAGLPLTTTDHRLFKWARSELQRRVLLAMEKFFDRQAALARMETVALFNDAVRDMDVSINIMQDLRHIRDKAIRKYSTHLRDLLPVSVRGLAAQYYGTGALVQDLLQMFNEYLAEREKHFQVLGVLSRGRKPVDISLHVFLSHPLGRDYRQDVLGAAAVGDEVIPWTTKPTTVTATEVRRATMAHLKGNPQEHWRAVSTREVARQSEFAREMLMLPLSVKSPFVRMGAGRPRKGPAPPKRDKERLNFGPERFLDFSVGPMQDVRRGLEFLRAKDHAARTVQLSWPSSWGAFQSMMRGLVEEVSTPSFPICIMTLRH